MPGRDMVEPEGLAAICLQVQDGSPSPSFSRALFSLRGPCRPRLRLLPLGFLPPALAGAPGAI